MSKTTTSCSIGSFVIHVVEYIEKRWESCLKFAGEKTPIQSSTDGLSCERSTLTHAVSSPCNQKLSQETLLGCKGKGKGKPRNQDTRIGTEEGGRSSDGSGIVKAESDPVDGDFREWLLP